MNTQTDERQASAGQVERPVRPLEVAAALRAYQQGDMDGVMVLVSRQACDEGAEWLERLNREAEVRYYEREQARARTDAAVKLLTGIYSLLYPTPIKTGDGRTMMFRPSSPDPHEVLQELSDRIRALPDELEKLELPNVEVTGRL